MRLLSFPPRSAICAIVMLVMLVPGAYLQPVTAQAPANRFMWALDPSFGDGGIVTHYWGQVYDWRASTFSLGDGGFILYLEYDIPGRGRQHVSWNGRYTRSGQLIAEQDPLFNMLAARQSTHKLLMWRDDARQRRELMRLNPDLTADWSFRQDQSLYPSAYGCCAVVQQDDKILVFTDEGMLRRLNPDGALDSTFRDDVGPFKNIVSIYSLPNRAFVVQETETTSGDCSTHLYSSIGVHLALINHASIGENSTDDCRLPATFAGYPDGSFLRANSTTIYRVRADGTPDTDFGDGGHLRVGQDTGTYYSVPLVVQPDGGFIVVAADSDTHNWPHYFLKRYSVDGALDQTYMNGVLPVPAWAGRPQLLPDGTLLVLGNNPPYFALLRLRLVPVRASMFLPQVSK